MMKLAKLIRYKGGQQYEMGKFISIPRTHRIVIFYRYDGACFVCRSLKKDTKIALTIFMNVLIVLLQHLIVLLLRQSFQLLYLNQN